MSIVSMIVDTWMRFGGQQMNLWNDELVEMMVLAKRSLPYMKFLNFFETRIAVTRWTGWTGWRIDRRIDLGGERLTLRSKKQKWMEISRNLDVV